MSSLHRAPGEAVRQAGRVGVLVAALGAVAWTSGSPFVFPSLGPTAYVLAVAPNAETSHPRRVFGGHAVGVVAGLAAYHLLAPELSLTALPPAWSTAGLRLAASGVLATALTSLGMLLSDLRHAPACATTLIVGLGLLAAPLEGVIILAAIAVLLAVDRGLTALGEATR